MQGGIGRAGSAEFALKNRQFRDFLRAEGKSIQLVDDGPDGSAYFDIANASEGQVGIEFTPFGREI